MESAALVFQIIIALGIANVWLLRFGRATAWRGGAATNMKEEFEVYGLSENFMRVVGFLKILFAVGLIAGIWLPGITRFAALGMLALMVGAVSMHIKVRDPITKSIPAISMLAMSAFVAAAG